MNGIYTEIYPLKFKIMTPRLSSVALTPNSRRRAKQDAEMYLRPYKVLTICIEGATGQMTLNYELENTIGEYQILNTGVGLYEIRLKGLPSMDGSKNMYVAVNNITAVTAPDQLRLDEYYDNVIYFSTTTGVFYESFVEIRIYNNKI